MQGTGKKRWFKLGLIGWLSTTGLILTFIGAINYVFFSGVREAGVPLDEKLVIQLYEEDNEYFGRKGKKRLAKIGKVQTVPVRTENKQPNQAIKKAQYI